MPTGKWAGHAHCYKNIIIMLLGGNADVPDGVFQTDRLGSLLCCNTQRAGFWHVSPYIGKKNLKKCAESDNFQILI